MFRKICLALLLTLYLGVAHASPTTIFVAGDIHYFAPELTDYGPFFNWYISNGDGKVIQYIDAVMETFVDEVIDAHPDALILPGDLTFNGQKVSHERLAEKLMRIQRHGIPVFAMPGNHDLLSSRSISFSGDGYSYVDHVNQQEFINIYSALGYGEALSQDLHSLSYMGKINDSLRVLLLDVNGGVQMNWVSGQTATWAREQLEQAERDGCRIITVSHQNIVSQSEDISYGFVMDNPETLLRIYKRFPIICNLSGHVHMQHIAQSDDGLFDIATSSLAVSPNQYGILTIDGDEVHYTTKRLDVSSWARRQNLSDANLLNFDDYALNFFLDTTRRQLANEIQNDPDPDALIDYMAHANAAYFAGRLDAFRIQQTMMDRLLNQQSFFAIYIQSVLARQKTSQCDIIWKMSAQ